MALCLLAPPLVWVDGKRDCSAKGFDNVTVRRDNRCGCECNSGVEPPIRVVTARIRILEHVMSARPQSRRKHKCSLPCAQLLATSLYRLKLPTHELLVFHVLSKCYQRCLLKVD